MSDGQAAGSTPILDEAAALLTELYGERLATLRIEQLIVGVFFTGVRLSDGATGVAYTPPEMVQRASTRILKGKLPRYRGMPVAEVLQGGHLGPFAELVRLTTLNALSSEWLTGARYTHTDGDDLSAFAELFTGRRVAMVGAIVPLLRKLATLAPADVAIIDKKEETKAEFSGGHFVPLEQTMEALGHCETGVFTGASVANGSVLTLLAALPENAAAAIVGPTASFVPEPLFARGVAVVATSVVTDGDEAMEIIAEGGGAYQFFGTCVRKINLINPAWTRRLQAPHS